MAWVYDVNQGVSCETGPYI